MEWLLRETHRRMRWKNGKGETVEMAVEPKGASIDTFHWRVSTAAVVEDGLFSTFEGIDRTLAVLSGGALHLTIDTAPSCRLDSTSPPKSFAADARCHARLEGEAVADLNVMARRGVYRHALRRLLSGECVIQTSAHAVIVAAPACASVQIDAQTLELRSLDAVRLDSSHRITLIRGDAWLAQFDPESG